MGCAISIESPEPAAPKKKGGAGGAKRKPGPKKEKQQGSANGTVDTSSGSAGGEGAKKGSKPERPEDRSGGSAKGSAGKKDSGGGGSGDKSGDSSQGNNSGGAKKEKNSSTGAGGVITEEQLAAITGLENLRKFSYKEMQKATKKFSTKLGEGGFGSVFKGRVAVLDKETGKPQEDGQQVSVAVKVLDPSSHQGAHEWMTEVEHLAALRHKHVVRLLGYCQEQGHWSLVYEFVPYGSFDYHLFAPDRPPVPFTERLKVVLHAARGLQFLHDNNVIYRDFKTSNILVDQAFNAKLADFGLARAGPGDSGTHVSTGVKGTMSYMAPEYISTGHLTPKCDVYSFGVVLLEILSGRQASATEDSSGKPVLRLVEFSQKVGQDKVRMMELLDQRLRDTTVSDGIIRPGPQVPAKAFKIVLQAAIFCLDRHAQVRPEMKTLVESLAVAHSICERAAEMKAKEAAAEEGKGS